MDGRLKKVKQTEEEYRSYVIVTEPGGRAVVTDRGLHVTEFDSIEKARDYIDSLR